MYLRPEGPSNPRTPKIYEFLPRNPSSELHRHLASRSNKTVPSRIESNPSGWGDSLLGSFFPLLAEGHRLDCCVSEFLLLAVIGLGT